MGKKLVAICAVIVVLGIIAYAVRRSTFTKDSQPSTRIAVNIPLTGPIAAFSGQYANGLKMGVEDACRDFGISPEQFSMDIQDNEGKPAIAVSVAERQSLSGFDIYISGTSDSSRAVSSTLDDLPSPHVLLAFDAFMTAESGNRLRFFPHFKLMGPMFSSYASKKHAKKICSITLNNSSTQEVFSKIIIPELAKNGIEHRLETFERGTTDFREIAQKLVNWQPDMVFVSGFSVQILPAIRALRELNYIEQGNVLCAMDFVDLLSEPIAREELVGVAFITPTAMLQPATSQFESWIANYKSRFGISPNYVPAFGYDTGYLIVLAQKNSTWVTKKSLIEQLPFDGVVGRIDVDASGDLVGTLEVAIVNVDGSISSISRAGSTGMTPSNTN